MFSLIEAVVFATLVGEVTPIQWMISGFFSGGSIIALVIHYLLRSPQREAEAYRQGQIDEEKRCAEDIQQLRVELFEARAQTRGLHRGLLSILMLADLTPSQRSDIKSAIELVLQKQDQLW